MSENPDRRSAKARGWMINVGLLAAAAAIFVVCLTFGAPSHETEESFAGTDSTAMTSIEESHPSYRPWFTAVFSPPSAEVESGLFAMQAALGAGAFGYALGALRRRRGSDQSADSGLR